MKKTILFVVAFCLSFPAASNGPTSPLPAPAAACGTPAALHNPHCVGGVAGGGGGATGGSSGGASAVGSASSPGSSNGSVKAYSNTEMYLVAGGIVLFFYASICSYENYKNPETFFAKNCDLGLGKYFPRGIVTDFSSSYSPSMAD